ncbi:hypothetical protein L6R53_04005 [Myxococcota bacterium]|nr:hypothetical protein [Myxococcota bacterium]
MPLTLALMLATAAANAGPAAPLSRPPPTDTWVRVPDDALLCSHLGGQGQCARFLQPGASPPTGAGPRLARVVAEHGDQVELQLQYAPELAGCGVLAARVSALRLRVFVDADLLVPVDPDAACVDPDAATDPGPGRDPDLRAARVATVPRETWVFWPDGALAGRTQRELWLQEDHGLYQEGGRWCATFDLGPDDGGAVTGRALDVCFRSRDISLR